MRQSVFHLGDVLGKTLTELLVDAFVLLFNSPVKIDGKTTNHVIRRGHGTVSQEYSKIVAFRALRRELSGLSASVKDGLTACDRASSVAFERDPRRHRQL